LSGTAQARDFTLLARLGLHLQYFQYQPERFSLTGIFKPARELGSHGAQIETR
jgi:hypothetical protein